MPCVIGLSYLSDIQQLPSQDHQRLEGRRILALLDHTSPEQNELLIKTEPSGRPFFTDQHADFSVSHSHKMIAVSLSKETVQPLRTGCDIQFIHPQKSHDPVIRRFFKPDEQHFINATPTPLEKNKRFTQIWTPKESYIKLYGLSITNIMDAPAFLLTDTAIDLSCNTDLAFYLYDLGDEITGFYSLAVTLELSCADGTPSVLPELRWFSKEILPIQNQAHSGTTEQDA